jgi:uncharacterized membrane protein
VGIIGEEVGMKGEIIVAIFPSRSVLTKALDRVMELDYIDIQRAAIIAKAASGETVILDDDLSADEGGIAGGTLGAAMAALGMVQFGALALPGVGAIIALGAGALVGSLIGGATGRFAADLIDFGFRNQQIEMLAKDLESGHPALVLELENGPDVLPKLREELKSYRAELVERLSDARANMQKTSKR